jgi:hypothetical protein
VLASPATAGPGVHAAKHHKKKSACRRLKAKKDLAPAKKVKLVKRKNADGGTDLVGCVLPRGKVRLIDSSADGDTSTSDYDLRQVAGAVLLIDSSSSSQYGGGAGTYVYDVRTGNAYSIASTCYELLFGYCDRNRPNTSAKSAFVNPLGQAAGVIGSGDTVSVAGFTSKGIRMDLDSGPPDQIPASSLTLSGSTVGWIHSGQQKSAQLSG